MNICYAVDSIIPSRTANSVHVMKMCQAYASHGHDVTLVVPDRKREAEAGVEDVYAFYGVKRNFRVCKVPLPRWRSGRVYFGLLLPFVVRLHRPSFVHSRNLGAAWGTTNIFRIPTVFELHQPPFNSRRGQALFDKTVASSHLVCLVSITRALAEHVRPFLRKQVNWLIAPDGVEESWLETDLDQAEARAALGLSTEMRRIAVYTGGLYDGRGIELIIETARHLGDHLFLVVGGRPDDIARYRGLAAGLPNVRFAGFVPPARVRQYLLAADVLLMPHANTVMSCGESDIAKFTSPMKMFEYMAAGRPILASTLPVLREVLEDGRNALLRPYDEPAEWVRALRDLQCDEGLATGLRRNAREDVRQYTWERRAERVLAAIR